MGTQKVVRNYSKLPQYAPHGMSAIPGANEEPTERPAYKQRVSSCVDVGAHIRHRIVLRDINAADFTASHRSLIRVDSGRDVVRTL